MRTIQVIENRYELRNVLTKEDVALRISLTGMDFSVSDKNFSVSQLSDHEITEFIREVLNDQGIVVTFKFL